MFCSIERGELEAIRVLDEDQVFAILDHRPVFPGHVLLIPRVHAETLPDLTPDLLEPFFGAAQRLSVGVRDGLAADGTFMGINNTVSQSVPHLHMHVIPRRKKDGLRGFYWPRTRYDDQDPIEQVAARIRAATPPG